MDLDFSLSGEVKISMILYVKNILKDFPKELENSIATPAADHLFQVQEESEARKLPEDQAIIFHHTTAQLLFLSS